MNGSTDNIEISAYSEAFHPSYVSIDDRSIQELFQLFIGYAGKIGFKDTNGKELGSWDKMYNSQLISLWSQISELDIAYLNKKKNDIQELWNLEGERKAAAYITEILKLLTSLYDLSFQLNANWAFGEIKSVIEDSIYVEINLIASKVDKSIHNKWLDKLNLWLAWCRETLQISMDEKEDATSYQELGRLNTKALFGNIVNDVLNCLYILKSKVKSKSFEERFYDGQHPPHIGLLFGFFKSFEAIQAQFNQLPKKHLDYYFKTILKQDLLVARPDMVHLFIKLIPGMARAEIPEGTAFVGGLDENGNDITFEAIRSFRTTSAAISEIKTLLFNKNPSFEPLDKPNMITGVYMDTIPKESIAKVLKAEDAWPLFGAPQRYDQNKNLPDLGWAVGLPIFHLTGGSRKLEMTFNLNIESSGHWHQLLTQISDTYKEQQHVDEGSFTRTDEILHRFFNDAFDLLITVPDGWGILEDYAVSVGILDLFDSEEIPAWDLRPLEKPGTKETEEDKKYDLPEAVQFSLKILDQFDSLISLKNKFIKKENEGSPLKDGEAEANYTRIRVSESLNRIASKLTALIPEEDIENLRINDFLKSYEDAQDRLNALRTWIKEAAKSETGGTISDKDRDDFQKVFNATSHALYEELELLTRHQYPKFIKFDFTLGPDLPPWIPYNESIHGKQYNTRFPLICFKLNQDSVYFPYSFLKGLELDSLQVNVSVKKFKELVIFNKHGLVDTSNPFPILGANPLKGNQFLLGAQEWRQKNISEINCRIQWMDLPKPDFETYYKEYASEDLRDESFKIKVSNGEEDLKPINLFKKKFERLQGDTDLGCIRINKAADYGTYDPADIFSPQNDPAAFLKFSLVGPEVGFGSEVYPDEMALYGQRVIKERKSKEMALPPRKPHVPIAKQIEVDYKAHCTIKESSKNRHGPPFDFFHIHPYGMVKEANESYVNSRRVLPNYDDRGYLFIGLDNAKPLSLLSIYFRLIPALEMLEEDIELTIDYLSGQNWESLAENTDENTIMGGQESGILRVFFPHDMESDHPLLDKNKNWIRITVDSKYLHLLGRCVYINTNVVIAKRRLLNTVDSYKLLQPNSISNVLDKNPSVLTVVQPFFSFGGHEKESESKFYARVSNRLGHKNRMVRPRDFRRMILEKFSEVNWIKVLTATGDKSRKQRGAVNLIVMPKIEVTTDRSNYYVPKLTQKNIEHYIREHCAPNIDIKVDSPDYEEVFVRCKLRRKDRNLMIPYIDIARTIRQMIAPWLFHEKTSYKQVKTQFSVAGLIKEMSRQTNVDSVVYCQVIHVYKEGSKYNYYDSYSHADVIKPSGRKSILIPARGFNVYQTEVQDAADMELSIGSMNVAETLIIKSQSQIKLNLYESLTFSKAELIAGNVKTIHISRRLYNPAAQICPNCGGEGLIRFDQKTERGELVITETCRVCEGKGKVEAQKEVRVKYRSPRYEDESLTLEIRMESENSIRIVVSDEIRKQKLSVLDPTGGEVSMENDILSAPQGIGDTIIIKIHGKGNESMTGEVYGNLILKLKIKRTRFLKLSKT